MKTKKILVELEITTEVNNDTLEAILKNAIKKEMPAEKIVVRIY